MLNSLHEVKLWRFSSYMYELQHVFHENGSCYQAGPVVRVLLLRWAGKRHPDPYMDQISVLQAELIFCRGGWWVGWACMAYQPGKPSPM